MSDKFKGLGGGHGPPACSHAGDGVKIGSATIYAGGSNYLWPEDMMEYDVRVLLRAERNDRNVKFGDAERGFLWLPIHDFKTVEETNWAIWKVRLTQVYEKIKQNKRVIVFCAGGHGRTGLFLASLLVLAEPEIDDPVAEIRRRYCNKAVETPEQAAQVMRLLRETRAVLTASEMEG